jgi:hypothetical protein
MAAKEPWYGVRCLFRDSQNGHYEERTIIVQANSHDEAIEKAEKEASDYCKSIGDIEYQNYADTFHIFSENITDGTEVFSLIRKTQIAKDDYIDQYLDTGLENRSDTPA